MLEFDKFYTKLTKDIKSEIEAEREQIIANADINELVNYYCVDKILHPVEIDPSRVTTSQIIKDIDGRMPDSYDKFMMFIEKPTDLEIEILIIEIPVITGPGHSIIRQLYGYIDTEKSIKLEEDIISIRIIIKEHKSIKKTSEVDHDTNEKKNKTFTWLKSVQQHLAGLNEHLFTDIKQCIKQRKEKILATKKRHEEIIRTINIPLKQKENAVVNKIRLDNTPIVKRIRPTVSTKEEYVLDRQKVLDIISVMDNQGRQFEKSPDSYKKLGEDDLRNILLVNLNAIFEGKAVGEAFSNKGKTDITLNIDKGNILIIECKIWDGSQKHMEAVSQLISYLTWRHNYGIVINFCRNRDMTKIIKTASQEIKKHQTFKRNGPVAKDTHFSTVHEFPNDSQKLIEVHHVFYNLYTKDQN